MPADCGITSSVFFKNDSVIMLESEDDRDRYAFQYHVLIKPVPKIGDTSTVYYYLKSNEDIQGGCDIMFDASGISIVSIPQKMNYSISAGQYIGLSVKIVPRPIRNDQKIGLSLNFEQTRKERFSGQTINCCFIFREDSLLKLINTEGFPPFHEELYPTNSPRKGHGIR